MCIRKHFLSIYYYWFIRIFIIFCFLRKRKIKTFSNSWTHVLDDSNLNKIMIIYLREYKEWVNVEQMLNIWLKLVGLFNLTCKQKYTIQKQQQESILYTLIIKYYIIIIIIIYGLYIYFLFFTLYNLYITKLDGRKIHSLCCIL